MVLEPHPFDDDAFKVQELLPKADFFRRESIIFNANAIFVNH